jgi:hypothetical protein
MDKYRAQECGEGSAHVNTHLQSMMRSMLGFQRRLAQKGSRYKSSFALGEKAGFVKPDGPVCLIILDGVGLGDMEVSILN